MDPETGEVLTPAQLEQQMHDGGAMTAKPSDMEPPEGGQEPADDERRSGDDRRAERAQTYVVQRRIAVDYDGEPGVIAWLDVGDPVTVAPRTKRKSIIEKALEASPIDAPAREGGGDPFRVLDADSAAEVPVRWEIPPAPDPVLVIG